MSAILPFQHHSVDWILCKLKYNDHSNTPAEMVSSGWSDKITGNQASQNKWRVKSIMLTPNNFVYVLTCMVKTLSGQYLSGVQSTIQLFMAVQKSWPVQNSVYLQKIAMITKMH